MTLWAWVADFPAQPIAIPATAATEQGDKGALSQVSQLSQGVAGEQVRHEGEQVSQLSQLSQPFGAAGAHGSDDDNEAFEERAAIMEFDGGLAREEAERLAGSAPFVPQNRIRSRWRGEGLDLDDLRPCTWCRNLARSGRCMAAAHSELRAASDYCPTFPDQPRRCVGYLPAADDPDQRPGRGRWPELAEVQSRK